MDPLDDKTYQLYKQEPLVLPLRNSITRIKVKPVWWKQAIMSFVWLALTLAITLWLSSCGPEPKCITKAGVKLLESPHQTTCEAIQPYEDRMVELYAKHGYTEWVFSGWSINTKSEIDERGSITRGSAGTIWCSPAKSLFCGELDKGISTRAYAHEFMHALACELGQDYVTHDSWSEKFEGETKWQSIDLVNAL